MVKQAHLEAVCPRCKKLIRVEAEMIEEGIWLKAWYDEVFRENGHRTRHEHQPVEAAA
jgi:hypothetical protein